MFVEDDGMINIDWFLRAKRAAEKTRKEKQEEKLYYNVETGEVLTVFGCKEYLRNKVNSKIFPIETIEFEMV